MFTYLSFGNWSEERKFNLYSSGRKAKPRSCQNTFYLHIHTKLCSCTLFNIWPVIQTKLGIWTWSQEPSSLLCSKNKQHFVFRNIQFNIIQFWFFSVKMINWVTSVETEWWHLILFFLNRCLPLCSYQIARCFFPVQEKALFSCPTSGGQNRFLYLNWWRMIVVMLCESTIIA